MNHLNTLERHRLDERARHYRTELGRAAREIGMATQLAPLALVSLRRLAPALPYVVLATTAGMLLMRMRTLRGAPKVLLIGGVLFDILRLAALARIAAPEGARGLASPGFREPVPGGEGPERSAARR